MKLSEKNNLKVVNPKLVKEWHPTKNGDLTPEMVTSGSGKKVWWICERGHEWQAIIHNRNKGVSCPYCSGKRASKEYNLEFKHPELAKQWHPTKNGKLNPRNFVPNSNKFAWWKCKNNHEWKARISKRVNGTGCPYCSGRLASTENNLEFKHPELAKQWHPTKNGSLKPSDVTPNSSKQVWWICKKGHEWQARIQSRSEGAGCPYCSGKRASKEYNLKRKNPKLAKEWHKTKNAGLAPEDVTPNSNKKVWWLCEKGHEWKASIYSRNEGIGCPYCSGREATEEYNLQIINPKLVREWHPTKNGILTPKDFTPNSGKKVWWICKKGHEWEARIDSRNRGTGCPYCTSATSLIELRVYSEIKYLFNDVKHRIKLFNQECDVFIPDLRLAIEIDGIYWHKNKYKKDVKKNSILNSKGITVLHIRESGLEKTSEIDIIKDIKQSDFELIKNILSYILKNFELKNEVEKKVKKYLIKGKLKNEKEFIKMFELLPLPLPGTSLADNDEKIASEWHPTKNGSLTPDQVTPGSAKKVWWICERGHEWQAIIYSRNRGTGCPYCSKRKASEEYNLEIINPKLAKEWHPIKNGTLIPRKVTPNSGKKVWWICKKGHEWEAIIDSRNRGTDCPYCSGNKVSKDNNLKNLNPKLAKEWHPTKNCELTPLDVTIGSHKKVWWVCLKGHEWEAQIKSRNQGSGCPYCSRRKKLIR